MKRILIVEDEEALLLSLKDNLQSEGYLVDVAQDGNVALVQVRKNRPDLILLDLLLPNKDGFTVLEEIKRDHEYKTIPIIVLSNLGGDVKTFEASADFSKVAMYADDYLIKAQHPIEEIIMKIKQYLNGEVRARVVETRD